MKMIMKIGFALSLLFFVVGLGSVIASVALGATWRLFTDAIDQGEFSIMTGNEFPRAIRTDKDETAQADSSLQYYSYVENLDIELSKGVLDVQETKEDEIYVEIISDPSHVIHTSLDDDTLKISGVSKDARNDAEVRLCIPDDEYFDEARLSVGAATVTVENLEADKLDVKLGAGTFSGIGEIISEESTWKIGVGELTLESLECEDTQIDCGMGVVSLTMSDSPDDYDCEVDCGAGAVTIGNKSFYMGHHTLSGDDADDEISIKCGMGAVDLMFDDNN